MAPKTILITGATGAIGKAIASAFLNQTDYTLVLHGYTHLEHLVDLAEIANNRGRALHIVKADLSSADGRLELIKQIHKLTPFVDILINNAGISQIGLFSDTSALEWQRVLEVNLTAPIELTKALLTGMIKQQYGRIVNISSIWGQVGASCEVLYSTTKAGLNGFTKALAAEVAPMGITVNAISPGVINSPMNSELSTLELENLCYQIPASRLGKPAEIAGLALYLASSEASYVTGQIINVDGGFIR